MMLATSMKLMVTVKVHKVVDFHLVVKCLKSPNLLRVHLAEACIHWIVVAPKNKT